VIALLELALALLDIDSLELALLEAPDDIVEEANALAETVEVNLEFTFHVSAFSASSAQLNSELSSHSSVCESESDVDPLTILALARSLVETLTGSLVETLTGSLVETLVETLTGSLVETLTGSLVETLTGSLVETLTGSLVETLVETLTGSLVETLVEPLIGSLVETLVEPLIGSLIELRTIADVNDGVVSKETIADTEDGIVTNDNGVAETLTGT
jgi:hypothetical protein